MNRGDPGIEKRGPVLRIHSRVMHVPREPRAVLGIDGGRAGDGERRDGGNGKLPHANLLGKLG